MARGRATLVPSLFIGSDGFCSRTAGLALLIALVGGGVGCHPVADRPPNLLLISIDTLRSDMLGCYGYERPTSPVIDALAARGTLFETAVATSPWTLPSHASLLTALYPSRHGARDEEHGVARGVVSWASVLRQHGFETAGIVNALYVSMRYGLGRGFETYRWVRQQPARRRPSGVQRKAAEWLRQAPQEPFFLFLHFYDVHSDYTSLPANEALFAHPYPGKINGSTAQLRRVRAGELSLEENDVERLVDLYVAGIRQVDEVIGTLLRVLDELGLADHTVVVLTSDHGEEFLEHGGVLHGRTQYEEVLRVPLILRGPGVPAGVRVREAVSLVDVMPTALGLLGVTAPPGLDGVDVSPLWSSTPPKELRDRLLFGDAVHADSKPVATHSVRHLGFKLRYDGLRDEATLHDLLRDPEEREDASARHPNMASKLRAALDRYRATLESGEALEALEADDVQRLRALGYL